MDRESALADKDNREEAMQPAAVSGESPPGQGFPTAERALPRGRGRPSRLSRETIIGDALTLLNEGSIDGFSMGVLAKRLSVGVMTLYSYFPSRDALLIAVADEIYSRFEYPAKGRRWQDELRDWMWATVRLFERYPVAMKLSLWDGHASPGWLRTWIPVVELLKAQGLEGSRLAFAVRWFTTSSLGFITSQPPPPLERVGRTTAHVDVLTPHEASLLLDLQLDMVEVDHVASLTYGFTHIIAGVERIIDETNNDFGPSRRGLG